MVQEEEDVRAGKSQPFKEEAVFFNALFGEFVGWWWWAAGNKFVGRTGMIRSARLCVKGSKVSGTGVVHRVGWCGWRIELLSTCCRR